MGRILPTSFAERQINKVRAITFLQGLKQKKGALTDPFGLTDK